MFEQGDSDRYDVTIEALQPKTRRLLSALLNQQFVIPTDEGLPRDWQGLFQLMGISSNFLPYLCEHRDPMQELLAVWFKEDTRGATVANLLLYLKKIDRTDVIEDLKTYIEKDLELYNQNPAVETSFYCGVDSDIFSRDDVIRKKEGLSLQKYDALVLFADDDADFAAKLIDKMEVEFQLKLCVKSRDLVVDLVNNENVYKQINSRCNKVIAIISTAFLESGCYRFLSQYARWMMEEKHSPKIVYCLYTTCEVPYELSCYSKFDYRHDGTLFDFWGKLRNSIQLNKPAPSKNATIYRTTSQRLPASVDMNRPKPFLNDNFNCLSPKSDGVKFNSMINLSFQDNNGISNENIATSSLNHEIKFDDDTKKSKTRIGWLKKFLSHKNEKCSNDIGCTPKRGFWSRHLKGKVALAN